MQGITHTINKKNAPQRSTRSKGTVNTRQGSINSNKIASSARGSVCSNKTTTSRIGYQDNLTPGNFSHFNL